jgi:hypothetical protein
MLVGVDEEHLLVAQFRTCKIQGETLPVGALERLQGRIGGTGTRVGRAAGGALHCDDVFRNGQQRAAATAADGHGIHGGLLGVADAISIAELSIDCNRAAGKNRLLQACCGGWRGAAQAADEDLRNAKSPPPAGIVRRHVE